MYVRTTCSAPSDKVRRDFKEKLDYFGISYHDTGTLIRSVYEGTDVSHALTIKALYIAEEGNDIFYDDGQKKRR